MTIKYLVNGQEVRLICKDDTDYIVRDLYEDVNTGEMREGDPYPVGMVYDKPLLPKYDKDVADIIETKAELQHELFKLKAEYIKLEVDYKNRLLELSKYEPLRNLEKFLKGEITHYVTIMGCLITVNPLHVATRDKEIMLLSLFGRTGGNIGWKSNYYTDGSGHWYEVIPCVSEEDAIEKAKELLQNLPEKLDWYETQQAVSSYKGLGLEIPEHVYAKYVSDRIDSVTKEAKTAKEKYEGLLKQLQELENEANPKDTTE